MTKTLLIAEAGVNHNGDIHLAKKLIDVAADAGADYVKFQTFKAKNLVTKTAQRAEYQNTNTKDSDTQFEMLKKLELSEEMHTELIDYCESKGIKFLSTAFDLESMDFLKSIGINLAKIPSGEITNLPYLKKIAQLFPEIIMSTGMADMQEIKEGYTVLLDNGAKKENITILHCNTEYPTPMEDVNLRAMLHIKDELGTQIGYSDHTLGIEVPIAAVALGATVIEKHFTLDRTLPGPDHAASLEPEELKAMVSGIRNIELAIAGSGIKEPSESEKKNIAIARKSLHTKHDLRKGDVLKAENLIALRPATGISPMEIEVVVGKTLVQDLKAGSTLEWNQLA